MNFQEFNNKSINCITFSSKSIIPKSKSKSLIDSNETKLSSLSMFLSLSQDKISSKKYVMHPDLMKSIQIYYSQNKHMKIPKAFIVPHREPWPQELWGYPLGSEFHIVRDIEGIGINRADTVISKKAMTQMVLETFKMYKKIYGHLDIKKDFVVQPNDNRWPSSMIGYPLGMLRYSIMSGNYKSIHSELDKIGFIWRYAEVRYEKILLALKIYKKLYGNLYIKVSFVVPNDNNWPKELHGFKLGRLCDNIRFKYINVDFIKPELDELGFIWNFAEYRWNMIERSFIIFKEVYYYILHKFNVFFLLRKLKLSN
jgi:hypothetical protein